MIAAARVRKRARTSLFVSRDADSFNSSGHIKELIASLAFSP
jgi:hypothetical protein